MTLHTRITAFYQASTKSAPKSSTRVSGSDLYLHRLLLELLVVMSLHRTRKRKGPALNKDFIDMCNLIAFLFTTTILAVLFFQGRRTL